MQMNIYEAHCHSFLRSIPRTTRAQTKEIRLMNIHEVLYTNEPTIAHVYMKNETIFLIIMKELK